MNIKKTQSALSIIEILIAVGLMSMILTALAVNMAYTQRSINNAQLRAKATDHIGSCMQKFRNLRDSNSWPTFCNKIDKLDVNAPNNEACGPNDIIEKNTDDEDITIATRELIITKCYKDGATEKAQITITVFYDDMSGIKRQVSQSQHFQKAPHESQYQP